MKMYLWFDILVVLATIAICYGQEDGKQYCQSIIQCYDEVAKLADECQRQKPVNSTSPTNNAANKCKAATSDKVALLKDKEKQYRQMILDCLRARVSEAMPVPAKRAATCQAAPSTSAGTGTVAGSRNKRQNSVRTETETNITKSSSTNDSGARLGAGGRGNGRGGGKGRGKGHNNGQGGCQKQVQQKRQQCKRIAKCCSELAYCHLKFELSDLHDQIRQTQLTIFEQRRQCLKQQQQGQSISGPSPNKVSPLGNNVFRDTAFDEDSDEDSFNFGHDED